MIRIEGTRIVNLGGRDASSYGVKWPAWLYTKNNAYDELSETLFSVSYTTLRGDEFADPDPRLAKVMYEFRQKYELVEVFATLDGKEVAKITGFRKK